ncbi:protein kinase [Actinoplanes sp. NPDC051470]|uniref:protein kinase domain-containing protein n=1 Tax=unclassified Actinoplanes TaxID=2626549 RepID=UPI00342104FE
MRGPLRPTDPRGIGVYRLESRLGQGGMGTVFLGRAPGGRPVAIKIIKPELAYEEEFRARFRSEVNRARQVPPFCTAELLDADADHETPYLVVEYVDGPSLADVVADHGRLSGGNLYSVAVGVATALAAIHGAGVIHRDLKPRNVLFSLGTPKVIDFGIARAFEATSQHTGTDQMVGTVAYMAPERFDADSARAVGPAADVFAWGVVVTYAGTGRTPFNGDSAAATAARILTQQPNLGDLPAPLRDIVALTLDKDPARRPTAAELLDMLVAAGGAGDTPELRHAAQAVRQPVAAASNATTVVSDRRRWGRTAPILAAVALIGIVLAGLLAFTPMRQLVEADSPAALAPAPSSSVENAPSPPAPSAVASRAAPAASPSATDKPKPPQDDAPSVAPSKARPKVRLCKSADVSVTISAQDDTPDAPGTHRALISVVNESGDRCRVDGRVFVRLYDAADGRIDVRTASVDEPGEALDTTLFPGGGAFQGMKWVACDRNECPAASTFRASLESSATGVVAQMDGFPDPGTPRIAMTSLQLGTLQPSRQGVVAW